MFDRKEVGQDSLTEGLFGCVLESSLVQHGPYDVTGRLPIVDRRSDGTQDPAAPVGPYQGMGVKLLVEGASTAAFDEPTGETVRVGQRQPKDAAHRENAVAFVENALGVGEIEVLQHVRGVDGANAPSLKRKALRNVEAADSAWPCDQVTRLKSDETVECPFGAWNPVKDEARGAIDVHPSWSCVLTASKIEHHPSHGRSLEVRLPAPEARRLHGTVIGEAPIKSRPFGGARLQNPHSGTDPGKAATAPSGSRVTRATT